MKRILLFSFLLPVFCFSQKIALIDRQLQKPVTYVDNISMKNIEQGSFLIYEKDMEDVIKNIEALRTVIDSKDRIDAKMKSFITGNTYFTASGRSNNYDIVIDTKSNKMGAYFVLSSKKKSNEENLAQIDRFLTYLKTNKS